MGVNVLHAGKTSVGINLGDDVGDDVVEEKNSEEVAELAAGWAGNDMPDSQEPYGGRVESRRLVDRKSLGSSSGASSSAGTARVDGSTPLGERGRPTKLAKFLSSSQAQIDALSDATREGGMVVAAAIEKAMMMQLEEGKKYEERIWEEKEKDRKAMLEGIAMLAAAMSGGPTSGRN